MIWPEHKEIAWTIFVAASLILAISTMMWVHAGFVFRWPFAKRHGEKITKFSAWPKPYSPEIIRGKHFLNEQILLDGFYYYQCIFENVSFKYNGMTQIQLKENHFVGQIALAASDNMAVTGAFFVMVALGMTDKPIRNIDLDGATNTLEPIQRR